MDNVEIGINTKGSFQHTNMNDFPLHLFVFFCMLPKYMLVFITIK